MVVVPIILSCALWAGDVPLEHQAATLGAVVLAEDDQELEGPPRPPPPRADAGPDADVLAEEKQREQDRKDAEDSAARAKKAEAEAAQKAAEAKAAILAEIYDVVALISAQHGAAADARLRVLAEVEERTKKLDEDLADARELVTTGVGLRDRNPTANPFFNKAVAGQQRAWDECRAALNDAALFEEQAVVAVRTSLESAEVALGDVQAVGNLDGLAEALAALSAAQGEVSDELRRFDDDRDRSFFAVAEATAQVARTYHRARLLLLDHVGPDQYRRLHEISDHDARANIKAAWAHASVGLRFHSQKRIRDVIGLPRRFGDDALFATSVLFALIRALLGILAAWWLYRRVPSAFKSVRQSFVKAAKTPLAARRRETTGQVVEALGPYLLFSGAAVFVFDSLQAVGPRTEMLLALEVTLFIAGYRAAAKLLHIMVVKLARRHHQLTPQTKLKALRSVRLLMRYAFIAAYILRTVHEMIGGGVVTTNIERGLVIGLVVCFLVVAFRWRTEITEQYREQNPDAALSKALAERGHGPLGFFYVLPALFFVVGGGIVALSRDFVLGFEQARRASAYLFQLRIERQAKDRPTTEVVIETLPDNVRQNFEDAPSTDRAITIDRFGDIPDAVRRMTEDTANTGLVLVHGPYGVGRTTWLLHLQDALTDKVPIKWWTPENRLRTEADFVSAAAALFDVELGHEGPTVGSLIDGLKDAPPTAVLVDGLEWFFLRGLGGYGALQALFDTVSHTQEKFAWAVTVPRPAYQFLSKSKRLRDHSSVDIELPRWNENEIRQLIQRRLKRCDISVSFDELLLQSGDAASPDEHLLDNEDGYLRLLWTFSEGNPRIAQYFWLRSLVRQNDQDFNVRRYSAPSANDLEVIPQGDRFILAAFVLHRALSAEEAAAACNLSPAQTLTHIRRCAERGIYVPCPQGHGRWVISVPWWEATLRFLRRKNLFTS